MKNIVHEAEVVGQPEICGSAFDLITPESSESKTMSLATIVIEPGKSSTRHYHKRMEEIYYIVDGIGRMWLGDSEHEVMGGSAIFIPINVPHHIENLGQTPLKLVSIDTPPFDPGDIYY